MAIFHGENGGLSGATSVLMMKFKVYTWVARWIFVSNGGLRPM